MIKAVLFDGDQTLWNFERVMRKALMATAAELRAARPGPFADALRWEDLQEDRAVVAADSPDVWSLAERRVLGFARTLARRRAHEGGDVGADDVLARELGESYFIHRDRDPALFGDTIPALDALRADYRLGLLSNGSRLPETVGLSSYFESVVFAQDHRVAKPDKGIFEVVERELGVGPEGACSWATIRSTTWPARTAPAGDRSGSTAMARCRSPRTGRGPTPWWPPSWSCPSSFPGSAVGPDHTQEAPAGPVRRRWRTCRAPPPRRSVRLCPAWRHRSA